MVPMPRFERGELSAESQRFNDAAAVVLTAIDGVIDRDDLLSRLSGSGWFLGEDHRGIELLVTSRGWVMQVFVEIGVGVTVRRWKEELGRIQPAQKTSWESAISVYPRYETGDPIFDDLRSCGGSTMGCAEVAEVLIEVKKILGSASMSV